MKNSAIPVVIAAGGLGTRVAGWSQMLPKEFRPVEGQPGLLHVLEEVATGGAKRAVVVHHPYYAKFYAWPCHALSPDAHHHYQQAAGQAARRRPAAGLNVDFIGQHGRYADITSVLNGADHLRVEHLAFAFADNVDPTHTALADLLAVTDPDLPAVLTAPFDVAGAGCHGVVVCSGSGAVRTMSTLIEKPGPEAAARLANAYGSDNLRLLQERGRVTPMLLRHFAAASRMAPGHAEPKLALAIADYARHQVVQVVTGAPLVDLGAPEPSAAAEVV
ncbi:hypothetical protein [Streptomyces sp. Y1]|uniref:MobA-like NTP transferase domain-containing protein n=1 Tax=Streptomyces sp. Y1 TaxID=3238634 RepID=A0AB39TWU4_9ACTN